MGMRKLSSFTIMAQSKTNNNFDRTKTGCFPAARIYCFEKSYCQRAAHIPLTARCAGAPGAISSLSYGFNIEEDAPNYCLVDTGSENSVTSSLHNNVYWLHGFEHLDGFNEQYQDRKCEMDVPAMCKKTADEIGCSVQCLSDVTAQDHENLISYLFSDKVFNVDRTEHVLFLVTTTYSVMHLYHGIMAVAPKTKSTVTFSDTVSHSADVGICVDLYNAALQLPCYEDTVDPLTLSLNDITIDGELVKSNVLSQLIHESYVLVMASAFNMTTNIDSCRRLLLLAGQASTFEGRVNKLGDFKLRDPIDNHKQAIASDMIDRCALNCFLGLGESYNECSPSAYYKSWALHKLKDKAIMAARCQKSYMAPFYFYAFTSSNGVGTGFKSELKTTSEMNNEKAYIEKNSKDQEKDQKKQNKELNQFKIIPGRCVSLPTAQRIIVAAGFSPHVSQYAFQVLDCMNDALRLSDEESYHRASSCYNCSGDNKGCFCRAIPKVIAGANISTAYGNTGNRIVGLFQLSNKVQTFGDLEQPPYNVNPTEEEKERCRKIKPSFIVNEVLSLLPEETKSTLDEIFQDPMGDVCSMTSRVNKLFLSVQQKQKNTDTDAKLGIDMEDNAHKRVEKSNIDYGIVIDAMKTLYNAVHSEALSYCKTAEQAIKQKRSSAQQSFSPKHFFQSSASLLNYSPYGPMTSICALRSTGYLLYVTVQTFICAEIFKTLTMQMSKLTNDNQLFNPNMSSIAKGYMNKNHCVKIDISIGMSEHQTLLRVSKSGECTEVPGNPLQTVNSTKPMSFKSVVFNGFLTDEEKTCNRIGLSLATEDSTGLLTGAEIGDILSGINNDSTDLKVVVMPRNNIGDSPVVEDKATLGEYVKFFREHDSDRVNSIFHKIFSRSDRNIRLEVTKSRGTQLGLRVANLVQYCINESLLQSREQIISLIKYAWLINRGYNTLKNGVSPTNCADLAYFLFENMVASMMNVKNEGFPLQSMNKLLPLVVCPSMKRNMITPVVSATLSSGYALQSNPLIMGTMGAFAFSSNVGIVLRSGFTGLNTSVLNRIGSMNIDKCSGRYDASKYHYMILPSTDNFMPVKHESNSIGLRVDEVQSTKDKLELCFNEEMAIKVLTDMVKSNDLQTEAEAIDEMHDLLDNHCDLFDNDDIIANVTSSCKRQWQAKVDEDVPQKKIKIDFVPV